MKITFVILQYGAAEETWACVESIEKNIDTEDYSIVIVDNNSPDNAFSVIQNKVALKRDGRLILLQSDKNEGFARGNNIGIHYARKNLDPDFIAVLNNDTELMSDRMSALLEQHYEKENFAVLGPLVLSGDGKYTTNPVAAHLFDMAAIEKEIRHTKRILTLNKWHLYNVYRAYMKMKHRSGKSDLSICRSIQRDVKLHGCFMVFSRRFFEHFDGFDPSTFLYMEEDILALRVVAAGLHTLYVPDIVVFHKEDASTDALHKSSREKTEFVFRNRLMSQQIYKKMLLSGE